MSMLLTTAPESVIKLYSGVSIKTVQFIKKRIQQHFDEVELLNVVDIVAFAKVRYKEITTRNSNDSSLYDGIVWILDNFEVAFKERNFEDLAILEILAEKLMPEIIGRQYS